MKRFLGLFSCALFLALASISQSAAISITAANVVPSLGAIYLPGDHYALATITAGQAVYVSSAVVNPTATTPDIGLANASGTGDAVKVVGIAVTGGSAGQPIKVVIRDPSLALGTGTCAAGDTIYLFTAAGGLTLTQADVTGTGVYVCFMGVGIGGGKINIGGTYLSGTTSGSKNAGVVRADVAHP